MKAPEQSSPFSDRLASTIARVGTPLCAGLDPTFGAIPKFIRATYEQQAQSDPAQAICNALSDLYSAALDGITNLLGVIKPNLAFFEQFGIGGLTAYSRITKAAQQRGILVISDAKRGDIGSTAQAYANAFLSNCNEGGWGGGDLRGDALTVNPFLGFDTLAPFIEQAQANSGGLFILVRTSNPGQKDLQMLANPAGQSASDVIAEWLHLKQETLWGHSSRSSGLGAVVGATTSQKQAARLRELMPNNWLLVPGVGAQGATMCDIIPLIDPQGAGVVVPLSRGIFDQTVSEASSISEITSRVRTNAEKFCGEFLTALSDGKRA